MSNLTQIERIKLEKILDMEGGYVLDFSNASFEGFVMDSIKIAIYDQKYDKYGDSKAKRLRAILDRESNYSVGRLLNDLIEYRKAKIQIGAFGINEVSATLEEECERIVKRLKQDSPVENLEALNPINDDKDFALVAKQIRESIEKNEPEAALDRLHTFCIKFFRELNDKHELSFTKESPLHNLAGRYIKKILSLEKVDSVMTERILKMSISVLDAFNQVRNNQSLAHDTPTLNYHESILIFSHVANTIKFIQFIEDSIQEETKEETKEETGSFSWDTEDLPF